MKLASFFYFSYFGAKTILGKKRAPILGTIIITDKCNLSCKHCSVNNVTGRMYSYQQIKGEMLALYHKGIRILFLCGGETFLWKDGNLELRDLVKTAKKIGFLIVNVVTNGTFFLDLPEADLILLSIDGDKIRHDAIRGESYELILKNIDRATSNNICLYMAINQINKHHVFDVAFLAKRHPKIRAISFNFHTPYPDTRQLALSKADKVRLKAQIEWLLTCGYPIFNLKSALPYLVENTFPTPCYQCVVMEDGKLSTCGRCIHIKDLCKECGYFFVAEYTLLFKGNLRILIEMLSTYLKFI